MRFNRGTALFPAIKARLTSSPLSSRLVESGGHVWIALDIPLNGSDGTELLENLVRQTRDVVNVAYPAA